MAAFAQPDEVVQEIGGERGKFGEVRDYERLQRVVVEEMSLLNIRRSMRFKVSKSYQKIRKVGPELKGQFDIVNY